MEMASQRRSDSPRIHPVWISTSTISSLEKPTRRPARQQVPQLAIGPQRRQRWPVVHTENWIMAGSSNRGGTI